MVCSPVSHYRIHIPEVPLPCEPGHEPGGWPGGIGAFAKCEMHFFGKINGIAFSYLQGRSQSLNDIDTAHCDGHSTLCVEGG